MPQDVNDLQPVFLEAILVRPFVRENDDVWDWEIDLPRIVFRGQEMPIFELFQDLVQIMCTLLVLRCTDIQDYNPLKPIGVIYVGCLPSCDDKRFSL